MGSINHSREFTRKFVEIMAIVMDRKIGSHLTTIDSIIGRKRVFLFVAAKVKELHMTGDAIALLIMSKEGVLQSI